MVQAVIGIFGKNEAMGHFEKARRFVSNKPGCQSLPEGHLLSSHLEEERTQRRISGRFL